MSSLRLLIVDDQKLFAEGLQSILQTRDPSVEVVGIAYDGKTGASMALDLRPDAILMDVMMPEMDGIEATRAIKDVWPEAKIMLAPMVKTTSVTF